MINYDSLFRTLRDYDTPTVCNALELPMGGRTAEGFTKHSPVVANPNLPAMVGFAKTVKIEATVPSSLPLSEVNELRLEYYRYAVSDPKPGIMVIEDTDWPNCIGAFWGELNVAIHKGLGNNGTLTNGLLRDLDEIDKNYQVIAGSIGPSHAHVRVTELDVPVNVLGLEIKPGDIIHADRHGAVIIPEKYLEVLPEAVEEIIRKEKPVLDAAKQDDFDIDKLLKVWKDFQNYKSSFVK